MTGQYDIGAASYRGKVVYTNTNSVSPYRGSGQPGSYSCCSSDSSTRRRAGSVSRPRAQAPEPRAGESASLTRPRLARPTTAATIRQCSTRRCVLRTSTGSSNVAAKRNPVACCAVSAFAAFVEVSGGVPVEWGALRIGTDRRVEVTTGIQNIGTGHRTTFPQIVAERLGVPVSCVTIRYGDTQFVKKGAGNARDRAQR